MVVLSDVADALGYPRTYNIHRHISASRKGPRPVSTPGGPQEMMCISKKGLLEAFWYLNPRKREKKKALANFRDWALNVLVDVMETGSHTAHTAPEPNGQAAPATTPDMSQMDALAQQSRLLADSIEQMAHMEQRIRKIESDREQSLNELRSLPEPAVDAPEVDDRTRLSQIVRAYCGNSGVPFGLAWGTLYKGDWNVSTPEVALHI